MTTTEIIISILMGVFFVVLFMHTIALERLENAKIDAEAKAEAEAKAKAEVKAEVKKVCKKMLKKKGR